MSKSIRNRHDKYGVNLKISGDSDKKDKRRANRKFRRRETLEERETLLTQEDMFKTKNIKDVSNTYEFSSDGLAYYTKLNETTRWIGPVPDDKKYKFKNK